MRVVVFAYQEVGCVCLEALAAAGADIALVLTHRDDPGEERWFRSVAEVAAGLNIPVRTPEDPNSPDILALVESCAPDLIFSFYYREMLSEAILGAAGRGAFNLHGSKLPRYRGRAPVNWVLVNGETETGVTLHRMVARPDAGPIVDQAPVPIDEADTIRDLYGKMTEAASGLMARVWPRMARGDFEETPQDEALATYYGGRRPEHGLLDWRIGSKQLYDLCRAVTHPYPGAFTFYRDRKLYVWSSRYDNEPVGDFSPGKVIGPRGDGLAVACGRGSLVITGAQWEGGPEVPGRALADRLARGRQLGR